jgi:acyl-CoA-dependent ceramide synthase
MFQLLFGLPDINCQIKGFWDFLGAIIVVLLGAKLYDITKKKLFKCSSEDKWMLICHGSLLSFGVILSTIYPIFNRNFAWNNWPCQRHVLLLEVYFWLQTSFYTHLLINEVSKIQGIDHTFMLHHIVTVILLFLSYMCNITRYASQITLVHNISDVFLFAMKNINSNDSYANLQPYSTFLFKASWISTRLCILPFIITPTAVHEISILLNENYWWPFYFSQPYALRILFFLFLSLLSLHIYWTVLVFCKGLKRITN